jgi:hypothetical protein
MTYPPGWVVTPGTATVLDQYDNYGYPYVYVDRATGSGSLKASTAFEVAYLKSHYAARLVSNRSIKLAGFPGRLIRLQGKDNGVDVTIQELVLVRGGVGYYISLYAERESFATDATTFETMYRTWRPR